MIVVYGPEYDPNLSLHLKGGHWSSGETTDLGRLKRVYTSDSSTNPPYLRYTVLYCTLCDFLRADLVFECTQEHRKAEISIRPEAGFRGYQGMGTNVTRYDGGFQRDMHEALDLYREEDPVLVKVYLDSPPPHPPFPLLYACLLF